MDFYRKLLSIFRKQQKPDAFTSPLLKKVPIEILLIIMDHLPLKSAVAFSLSCMYLKRNLGTQHLSRLASSTEDTLALLNLLVLDLPNCVVCSACKRLHEMENLRSYNSLTYSAGCTTPRYALSHPPACVSKDRKNDSYVITDLFGSVAVNMAIKRYQNQTDCTELLKIMSRETEIVDWGSHLRRYREECRFVRGHLMHRL